MMYKHFLLKTAAVTLLLLNGALISAQVTIGANKEAQSFSVLEIESNGMRGLRLPQIQDTIQRDIVFTNAPGFKDNAAALGLQIFNMCNKCVETWNGAKWISACAPMPEPHPDYLEYIKCGCDIVKLNVPLARRNVGAPGTFVDNETEIGMLYQWGKPTAWPATGTVTGWDTSASPDAVWAPENDPCPPGFRVPIITDYRNLIDLNLISSCYKLVEDYKGSGVNGVLFGDEPNHIFMPACWRKTDGDLNAITTKSIYWTRYATSQISNARTLDADFDPVLLSQHPNFNILSPNVQNKNIATPVRCVKE